ncbi:MAG: ribonuclease Y [Phycisphaerales bacterium]|jgi:ribonucrease Y|nr:ribonuclease Y [Phycisphaerales bacterium]MBT7170432.1 ribonuclease Y [Phycisphaerales bacterium]
MTPLLIAAGEAAASTGVQTFELPVLIGAAAGGLVLGLVVMALIKSASAKANRKTVEAEIAALKQAAQAEAQTIRVEAEAKAKSEFIKRREEFDRDTQETRKELREEEKRVAKREDTIDRKLDTLAAKEKNVATAEQSIADQKQHIEAKTKQLDEQIAQQKSQLLKISQLTREQAREILLQKIEKDVEMDAAKLIDQKLSEARETAEVEGREILLQAIQRYASEHTAEHTVSTVDIPSDDMKGRVIGREGRNIRAFEKATGVDVIVDDTPGVVVCSAFDPVRREVARRSLEKLIQDGRIHPTRIEEVVDSVQKDVGKEIVAAGKNAVVEANIRGLNPKLVELLGRLQFRTSYGQNVLRHSLEVGALSQVIAEQLGLNGELARRCGILHDIGKAVDHEVEGGHPQIGGDLLRRYGEKEEVINAAAGHHGDVEAISAYTPIVLAADAVSASRPGARRESLERYIQRLEKLEGIANAFEGVKSSYAIQAGREVRVIIDPENVDDRLMQKVAHDIAKQIEEEMEYPGEVQVTLIRETRCVDYAK